LNNVVIASYPIAAKGIESLLFGTGRYNSINTVFDYDAALSAVTDPRADIAIVDIALGNNGRNLVSDIRGNVEKLPLLVYTNNSQTLYSEYCFRVGANGYLMYSAKKEELIDALDTILEDGIYHSSYSNEVMESLVGLSPRQLEVVCLLADGMTPTQIGNMLSVSIKTVETHLKIAQEKLSLRSRKDLRYLLTIFRETLN